MTVTVRPRRSPDDPERYLADARASYSLAERAAAGDRDAFGEIWQQNHKTVYQFAYFRVGNRQLAEDIAQEVFCRALARIGQFKWQDTHIAAWLVTIARNLIADHFKSARYRLEVLSKSTSDASTSDRVDPSPGPAAAVADYLVGRDLLSVVLALSEDQQDVIIARFFRGLSVLETANELGKNEGAIKAIQYRATRSLGRLLEQAGLSPEQLVG